MKLRETQAANVITRADFWTPEARRGMFIGIMMMTLNIFTGSLLMLSYAANIFRDAGASIDPNLAAIVLITVQLVGLNIASLLVDRLGRRRMMIVSSVGTGTGMFLMGTHSFLTHMGVDVEGTGWVPVVSLSLAVFMSSLGLMPLVFVVLAEVLPMKIRELGSTLCLALISVFLFFVTKFYPILSEAVGMYSCFWFFSAYCFLGTVFSVFWLPETTGKSINASAH